MRGSGLLALPSRVLKALRSYSFKGYSTLPVKRLLYDVDCWN